MTDELRDTTNAALCAEDLLALERRRPLTDHEQRRLAMCLAASEPLQWLRQLGRDFDAQPEEESDLALITQASVDAARKRFAPRRRFARWPARGSLRASLVAASMLLLSMGAAAAWYGWSQAGAGTSGALPATTAAPVLVPAGAAGGRVQRQGRTATPLERVGNTAHDASSSPVAVASPDDTASPGDTASPDDTASPRLTSAVPRAELDLGARSVEGKSAADLFSLANVARRNGETQKAVLLYQRLQREHARSDEALLSYVLLGRLELARGAAARALRGFEAYVARAPSGSLAQEALHGKAQALGQLGRKQEEAAAWRHLLQRFPSSVYAQTAREHLDEGSP